MIAWLSTLVDDVSRCGVRGYGSNFTPKIPNFGRRIQSSIAFFPYRGGGNVATSCGAATCADAPTTPHAATHPPQPPIADPTVLLDTLPLEYTPPPSSVSF